MRLAVLVLLVTAPSFAEDPPPIQDGDILRFLYGLSPTKVICAPFKVCLIELEAGERIVNDGIHVGDTVRWAISVALGGRTPVIVVKPLDQDLETTMSILTDKRTYYLELRSDKREYMPRVAWLYPKQIAITQQQAEVTDQVHQATRTLPATGEDIAGLDFAYDISDCKCSFRPVRVYNDGQQTIIQFDGIALQGELPALLVIGPGGEGLVNYRLRNDRYVVDAVFDEAVLITGVGRKRQEVNITRASS